MSPEATLAQRDQAQVSIPLNRAMLCLDCDRVSEISRTGCPTCGAQTLAPLSAWLDRCLADEYLDGEPAVQTSAQDRA